MVAVVVNKFGGIAPRIANRKLSDHMAVEAVNVRMESGSLKPWRGILDKDSVPVNTQSIYPYNGGWLTSSHPRSYVESLVPNDAYDRIFYDEADYPRVQSGNGSYELGIPRPGDPSSTVISPGDLSDLSLERFQSYVITYVDAFGSEGPPSRPTRAVQVGVGGVVNVVFPTTPTGNYNFGPGALVRLYRSNTGSEASYFQFVAEYSFGTGSINDSAEPGDLQEALVSGNWTGPPNGNSVDFPFGPLQQLTEMPGGFIAGFSGNSVYFSERYVPTAYPLVYRVTQAPQIVGIVEITGGLLVTTKERPYIIAGSTPAAMVAVPIEADQACSSRRSIVDMGGYAIYATPDGLAIAERNNVTLLTRDHFTQDEWQAFNPSTIRAVKYENRYLAFYGPIDDGTGFMYTPGEDSGAFVTFSGLKVNGGYWDKENDELNLIYKNDEGQWRRGVFNKGFNLPIVWESKEFITPGFVSMVAYKVDAEQYPVILKVYADGLLRQTIEVLNEQPGRLKSNYSANKWNLKVEALGVVHRFGIWSDQEEVTWG